MQKVNFYDQKTEIAHTIQQYDFWKKYSDFELEKNVFQKTDELKTHLCESKTSLLVFVTYAPWEDFDAICDLLKFHSKLRIIVISRQKDYSIVHNYFTAGVFDYLLEESGEEEFEKSILRLYDSVGVIYILNNLKAETDRLITDIFAGGGQEESIITATVGKIFSDWNNDPVNCQLVCQKAKKYIYEIIIERKPWLEKFLYKNDFDVSARFELLTREQIISDWCDAFVQAGKMVKKYQMIDDRLVYKIGKYAVVHVDEMLSLDDVSRGVFLNSSYISHIFKKTTGVNFVDFMTDVKIDRAKVLLRDPDVLVKEVSQTLGYSAQEYFSRLFKKRTGLTPGEYQSRVHDVTV